MAISYTYNNSGSGMIKLTTMPISILHVRIELPAGLNNVPAQIQFSIDDANAIYCTTANGTTTYNYNNIHSNNPPFIINTVPPTIHTNLSQITKHAGVGDILIINGTNFGSIPGDFYFTSLRRGGTYNEQIEFLQAVDSWDITWSNTQIQVKVPSRIMRNYNPEDVSQGAGSGPIKIVTYDFQEVTSTSSLNIDYSIINVGTEDPTDTTSTYPVKRINLARTECDAEYVFTLHTNIQNHPDKTQIINAIETAFNNGRIFLKLTMFLFV